jgi:phosphate transport system ATP-binding protein
MMEDLPMQDATMVPMTDQEPQILGSEDGDRRAATPSPEQGPPQAVGVGPVVGGLEIVDLNAWFGANQALRGVNLSVQARSVTAIIGPSGCGKSTLVRCLNRMHEEVRGARASGKVLFNGEDIYAPDADPVEIRRRIGMVFQRPNPFPTLSVLDNAVAGLKLSGGLSRSQLHERAEWALRAAGLWDEVKDRLGDPGAKLSGGQQQRLCIARALAVQPEVLLMDEPASALDPASTLRIEDLIQELKNDYTVVIVTHNMQQAARVSEWTLFMLLGEAVEFAPTPKIFTKPDDKRTEDYVTGRFG